MHFWISLTESNLLMATRGEDWRVYLLLRQRASFKTGRLDHYSAKRMTAASIAREISLPASAGVPAMEMSRKDVSRSLARLVRCGLVSELTRERGFLRLRLPYAVVNTNKGAEGQNSMPQTDENRPPRVSHVETEQSVAAQDAAKRTETRLPPDASANCPRQSQGEIKKSSETVAVQAICGSESASVNSKNKVNNKPPVFRGETPSPSALKPHLDRSTSGLPENPEEPADRYRSIVEEESKGIIMFTGSDMSRNIFRRWALIKAGERDIRDAVREVMTTASMRQTPNSVDEVLRSKMIAPPKSTKGSICL